MYIKSWRVVFLPTILWLGCLACAILTDISYRIPQSLGFPNSLAIRDAGYIVTAFYTCNIVINIYATGTSLCYLPHRNMAKSCVAMIVYRILRVAHNIKAVGRVRHLYSATRVIAESGILYTLTSLFRLVAVWDPSASNYFSDITDAVVCPSIVCFSNDHNLSLFRTSQWQGLRSILS